MSTQLITADWLRVLLICCNQTKDIAEDPHFRDLIAAERKHGSSRVPGQFASGRDAEEFAAMRSTILQASGSLVALGDHVLDFVSEIRKRSLNEVEANGSCPISDVSGEQSQDPVSQLLHLSQ